MTDLISEADSIRLKQIFDRNVYIATTIMSFGVASYGVCHHSPFLIAHGSIWAGLGLWKARRRHKQLSRCQALVKIFS